MGDVLLEELLDVAGVLFAEVPIFTGGFVADVKGLFRRGRFETPVLKCGVGAGVESEENAVFLAIRGAERFDEFSAEEI